MPITLADGQLAATSTTILGANTVGAGLERTVDVYLANTSPSYNETIILTVSRAGGTARRIAYLSLAPNETASVLGLPMAASDVLAGYATDASLVDYDVTTSPPAVQRTIEVRDDSGVPKTSPALLEQLAVLLA